jgi:predicted nucleic acid-binding protein
MLSFCFLDEQPANAEAVLRRLSRSGMIAPAHWPLEMTNILAMAERRGRISNEQAHEFIGFVLDLGVDVDAETADRAWAETRLLSASHKLTSYDAAYLELALRRGARLATRDAGMIKAALKQKVDLVDMT